MLEQRARDGNLQRKRSQLWLSHEALAVPFRNLMCDNSHYHSTVQGSDTHDTQLYTWELANRAVAGFQKLIATKRELRGYPVQAFPSTGSGPSDAPAPASSSTDNSPAEAWRRCPGCRARARKDDPTHTRVDGECKHPHETSSKWTCPGCVPKAPRHDLRHNLTPGECKWAVAPTRGQQKQRDEPRRPNVEEPTASLRLPSQAEEEIPDPLDLEPQLPADAIAVPRAGRGPDSEQRIRRVIVEEGTAVPAGEEWTSFDTSTALRILRAGNEGSIRRTLRRLHVRWWRASTGTMTKVLSAAGLPKSTLDLIAPIVDTCRACRDWANPLSRSIASSVLSMTFNETIQCDLCFYKAFIIFHIVDMATRWHATVEIANKR